MWYRRVWWPCLLLACLAEARIDNRALAQLIPSQSCYYLSYSRVLNCNCNSTDTSATMDFELGYYIGQSGDDIREVMVAQCKELYVRLDLRGVDATNFALTFKYITKLVVESVEFEPLYSDRQELRLKFNSVEQLSLSNLNVQDTVNIDAMDVKEVRIHNSTFAHIPVRGVEISRANLIEITGSRFLRIAHKSIVVDKIKQVTVIDNEMTVNAFTVVFAKDGSHLMISCNRLLGQRPSTDCTTTTTTTTTTSSTTTTTTTTTRRPSVVIFSGGSNAVSAPASEDEDETFAHFPEVIGGVVGGLLVITIVLLLLILLRQRKRKDDSGKMANGNTEHAVENGGGGNEPISQPGSPEHKETDSLLEPQPAAAATAPAEEYEEDEDRPKFTSPIWLEEIQKNKIFNRQKSLLSEDRLADLAGGGVDNADSSADSGKLDSVQEDAVELTRLSAEDEGHDDSDYDQLPDPPTPPPPIVTVNTIVTTLPQTVSADSVLDGQKQDEVAI